MTSPGGGVRQTDGVGDLKCITGQLESGGAGDSGGDPPPPAAGNRHRPSESQLTPLGSLSGTAPPRTSRAHVG